MDIFDYLKNEKRTFSQKAFSVVDSIVLSKLVYLKFDNVLPKDGMKLKDTFKAEYYEGILDVMTHKEDFTQLYTLAVLSPRFRDIVLKYYVADSDAKAIKQFAAITFILGDKIYVAFRGTDTSVLGWKENFHMTFTYPIESQRQATKYLQNVYSKEKKKMLVGGHSKGGNLAVYSAITAEPETKKDILRIYSLDGPGFPDEVFESKEYKEIRNKIVKILPQESFIGIMFEKDKYLVCKSNQKGLLQHEPFHWQIKDGELQYLKTISKASINFSRVMYKWLESATIEERELFIDTLFSMVQQDKMPNLYSKLAIIQETPKLIKRYNKLEPDRKEFISTIFKNLFNIVVGKDEKEAKKLKK